MSPDHADLWASVSGLIAARLSQDSYQRWFSECSLHRVDDESVTLAVPNAIHQFWIETNFLSIVEAAVRSVTGPREIAFRCVDHPDGEAVVNRTAPAAATAVPAGADPSTEGRQAARAPKLADRPASPMLPPDRWKLCRLHPDYHFSTFVVGSTNEFAEAACQGAASMPGTRYNPLFLFGESGVGKTHLMHAIGHAVLDRSPRRKVVCVSGETFVNEFIQALREGSLAQFRKRYRTADVLLIDDIQFLAGKERSQDEFFHTFNTIVDGRRQIVMSCDRPAGEIANLEKRLLSRVEWGLSAQILPPDQETRIAILRQKAQMWGVEVAPELLEFIGTRIRSNVRRLEGALRCIVTVASMRGSSPDLDIQTAGTHLASFLRDEHARDLSPQDIQKKVAEHHDLRVSDLTGRKRPAQIARARHVAMYYCRTILQLPYQQIGECFGGREHGAVMHACRKVEALIKEDTDFRNEVQILADRVRRP